MTPTSRVHSPFLDTHSPLQSRSRCRSPYRITLLRLQLQLQLPWCLLPVAWLCVNLVLRSSICQSATHLTVHRRQQQLQIAFFVIFICIFFYFFYSVRFYPHKSVGGVLLLWLGGALIHVCLSRIVVANCRAQIVVAWTASTANLQLASLEECATLQLHQPTQCPAITESVRNGLWGRGLGWHCTGKKYM